MPQLLERHLIIPGTVVREQRAPRSNTQAVLNIESLPRVVNITCYQGDTFRLRLVIWDGDGNEADLSNLTPASQIRRRPDSSEVLGEFSGFQITDNVIETQLTASQMAFGVMPAGSWYWDFQVTDPIGEVQTYCAGRFTVAPEVTRG